MAEAFPIRDRAPPITAVHPRRTIVKRWRAVPAIRPQDCVGHPVHPLSGTMQGVADRVLLAAHAEAFHQAPRGHVLGEALGSDPPQAEVFEADPQHGTRRFSSQTLARVCRVDHPPQFGLHGAGLVGDLSLGLSLVAVGGSLWSSYLAHLAARREMPARSDRDDAWRLIRSKGGCAGVGAGRSAGRAESAPSRWGPAGGGRPPGRGSTADRDPVADGVPVGRR